MAAYRLTKNYRVRQARRGAIGGLVDILVPRYQEVSAVKDLSIEIEHGQVVGFVGPNGAGKSTIVKLLAGVLRPTSGSIAVNGRDPANNSLMHRRRLGVVFGQRSRLFWDLPAIDTFGYHAAVYRLDREEYQKSLEELQQIFDLQEVLSQPVRTLSLGQRMRCELALALLHHPALLLLDEPTIGLDFEAKDSWRKSVANAVEEYGTTVLLTSHDLDDVEALCQEIVLLESGQAIYRGTPSTLREQLGIRPYLFVRLANAPDLRDVSTRLKGEADVIESDGGLRIEYDSPQTPAVVLEYLAARAQILEFRMHDPDIEDVVRAAYQKSPARKEP